MATAKKNGTSQSGNTTKLQGFVREQVEDAQKRLASFETEAQQVLGNLMERGQKSRKDLEKLLQKFNGIEVRDLNPLDKAQVKKLGKKATSASNEVRRRVEEIQNKVVQSVGFASQAQVQQINKELTKLSKKLDSLVGPAQKKGAAKSETRN